MKYLSQLRMDRQIFNKYCKLLRDKGGLLGSKKMSPEEMLAMVFVYFSTPHEELSDWFQF